MDILQSLRHSWQANSDLETWLPARYLTFVTNPYNRYPQATIQMQPLEASGRTNAGTVIRNAEFSIFVSDTSCESLIPQLDRIEQLYDWSKYYIDNDTVVATVRFRDSFLDCKDGIWSAQLRFRLILSAVFE